MDSISTTFRTTNRKCRLSTPTQKSESNNITILPSYQAFGYDMITHQSNRPH